MSNGEKARNLLASAHEYRDFMETALGRESWNVAVREAQEVIELSLKGVLNFLLVEYPRAHDVGERFLRTLAERRIEVSEAEAGTVRDASAELAKKRAAVFYFDLDENAESAAEAAASARRVHDLCLRILAGLGWTADAD